NSSCSFSSPFFLKVGTRAGSCPECTPEPSPRVQPNSPNGWSRLPAPGSLRLSRLSCGDSLLVTIVLATLAIGLPILLVLAIRFLWDRRLNLGRSKELEKLIWQLHRIASAMEHQMSLSFPAVQPGTEEPRDLAFLQQPTAATG